MAAHVRCHRGDRRAGGKVEPHAAVDLLDRTDRTHERAGRTDTGREGPALCVLERIELGRGTLVLERMSMVALRLHKMKRGRVVVREQLIGDSPRAGRPRRPRHRAWLELLLMSLCGCPLVGCLPTVRLRAHVIGTNLPSARDEPNHGRAANEEPNKARSSQLHHVACGSKHDA